MDDLGGSRSETVEIEPQVAVPPSDPAFTTAVAQNGFTPGDGGGSFEVAFTHENFPVGWTVDIDVVTTAGDPITAASGGGTGFTSSPATINMALGNGAAVEVTLTARNSGGTPIAPYFFDSAVPV